LILNAFGITLHENAIWSQLQEDNPMWQQEFTWFFGDCSESTGLPSEDVYRKVRVRTFALGGQHNVRSR